MLINFKIEQVKDTYYNLGHNKIKSTEIVYNLYISRNNKLVNKNIINPKEVKKGKRNK